MEMAATRDDEVEGTKKSKKKSKHKGAADQDD